MKKETQINLVIHLMDLMVIRARKTMAIMEATHQAATVVLATISVTFFKESVLDNQGYHTTLTLHEQVENRVEAQKCVIS